MAASVRVAVLEGADGGGRSEAAARGGGGGVGPSDEALLMEALLTLRPLKYAAKPATAMPAPTILNAV